MAFEIAKSGWLHRQSTVLKKWKRNWFVLYVDGHLKYFDSPDKHVAEEAVRMQTECARIICGLDLTDVNPPSNMTRNCLFQLKFRDKVWNCCAESMDDMRAWQVALEQSRSVSGLPGQAMPKQAMPGEAPPPYTPGAATYHPPQQAGYPPQFTGYPPQMQQAGYPAQSRTTTTYIHPHNATSTTTVVQQGQSPYPVQGAAVGYPGQTYYGSHPPQHIVHNPAAQQQVIYVNGQPQHHRGYGGSDVAMGFVAGAAMGSMMYGPLWW